MEKYQTKASKAEAHVLNMLKAENSIIRPWALLGHKMYTRTLQTTADEVNIIFSNFANVRPGYEIKDNAVYIPNLFVKILGYDSAFEAFYNERSYKERENCLSYSSLKDFNSIECLEIDDSYIINKEGLIDKDKLMASEKFKYSFLRKEYQDIFIEKINEILKNIDTYFVGLARTEERNKAVSYLLSIDNKIMESFNSFHFQSQPPSVILKNDGHEKLTSHQAYVLVLLNLLGFDIILLSPGSTSDIENMVNELFYNLYNCEDNMPITKSKKLIPIFTKIIALTITAAVLLTSAKYVYSKINTSFGLNIINVFKSSQFKDKEFENHIRKLLAKPEGRLTSEELASIDKIKIIGNSLVTDDKVVFDDSQNMIGYIANNGIQYSFHDYDSKGNISSLHDLRLLKGLKDLCIRHNKISRLDGLEFAKNIVYLDLSYNHIADLRGIQELNNLKHLELANNEITDISILNSLNFSSLYIVKNPISDKIILNELEKKGVKVLR